MAEKKQHFWIDRQHPRVNATQTCTVARLDGAAHTAQMLNLSAGGIKFSCSNETFIDLLPESQRTPGLVQNVLIKVQFRLAANNGGQLHDIKTQATVIHTERLAQDCYHVGAQFSELGEAEVSALERYVGMPE